MLLSMYLIISTISCRVSQIPMHHKKMIKTQIFLLVHSIIHTMQVNQPEKHTNNNNVIVDVLLLFIITRLYVVFQAMYCVS